jgi:hypothetical protein
MRFLRAIIIMLITGLASGCDKKRLPPPLPEPPPVTTEQKAGFPGPYMNVYLFALQSDYDHFLKIYRNGVAFAAFSDPEKKLMANFDRREGNFTRLSDFQMPNVSAGEVSFNHYQLSKMESASDVFYIQYLEIEIPMADAYWKTSGNRSFPALNHKVDRRFPVLNPQWTKQARFINPKKGLTLITDSIVSNYDSLSVLLKWDNGFPGSPGIRSVTGREKEISFSPSVLSKFRNYSTLTMQVMAYNFSSQVIENKTHAYELAIRAETSVPIDTLQ